MLESVMRGSTVTLFRDIGEAFPPPHTHTPQVIVLQFSLEDGRPRTVEEVGKNSSIAGGMHGWGG